MTVDELVARLEAFPGYYLVAVGMPYPECEGDPQAERMESADCVEFRTRTYHGATTTEVVVFHEHP